MIYFQWKYTYHNSNIILDDVGVSITRDNSGKIYVTGSSGGDTTLFDYVTIALNANTGFQIWESREVATVSYSTSNVTRINTSTIPQNIENLGDMVADNNGNLYITGSLYNDSTISNNVALLKFDTDLQLTGLFLYDFNGYDDKGNGITLQLYHNDDNPWASTFPSGFYNNCKRYKFEWHINENLPAGHEIIDWWDVEALVERGTYSGSPQTGTGTNIYHTMPYDPIGGNSVSRNAFTYLYQVNGIWYPKHPNDLKYGFSIHVLKDPNISAPAVEKDNVILFPNPSNDKITIKSGEPIDQIQIFDVSGRLVYDNMRIEKQQETIIDIANFRIGLYYCKVISSNTATSIPFIKSE